MILENYKVGTVLRVLKAHTARRTPESTIDLKKGDLLFVDKLDGDRLHCVVGRRLGTNMGDICTTEPVELSNLTKKELFGTYYVFSCDKFIDKAWLLERKACTPGLEWWDKNIGNTGCNQASLARMLLTRQPWLNNDPPMASWLDWLKNKLMLDDKDGALKQRTDITAAAEEAMRTHGWMPCRGMAVRYKGVECPTVLVVHGLELLNGKIRALLLTCKPFDENAACQANPATLDEIEPVPDKDPCWNNSTVEEARNAACVAYGAMSYGTRRAMRIEHYKDNARLQGLGSPDPMSMHVLNLDYERRPVEWIDCNNNQLNPGRAYRLNPAFDPLKKRKVVLDTILSADFRLCVKHPDGDIIPLDKLHKMYSVKTIAGSCTNCGVIPLKVEIEIPDA